MKFRQDADRSEGAARWLGPDLRAGNPTRRKSRSTEAMVAKWIPGVATFGLICLMVLPAPGIWGVLIGGTCVVAIIVSALIWMLDTVSSRLLARYARWRGRRSASSRRAIHSGSGMAKRVDARKLAGKRA